MRVVWADRITGLMFCHGSACLCCFLTVKEQKQAARQQRAFLDVRLVTLWHGLLDRSTL